MNTVYTTTSKWLVLYVLITVTSIVSAKVLNANQENYVFKMDENQNYHISKSDKGVLSNCGDPGNEFKFEYSPKVLSSTMKLTVTAHFKPEMDWSSGQYKATVWVPQYPDSPIFDDTKSINCSFFKIMPNLCPFKKGNVMNVNDKEFDIDLPIQVPEGDYILRFSLLDSGSKEFLCFNGTISFSGN